MSDTYDNLEMGLEDLFDLQGVDLPRLPDLPDDLVEVMLEHFENNVADAGAFEALRARITDTLRPVVSINNCGNMRSDIERLIQTEARSFVKCMLVNNEAQGRGLAITPGVVDVEHDVAKLWGAVTSRWSWTKLWEEIVAKIPTLRWPKLPKPGKPPKPGKKRKVRKPAKVSKKRRPIRGWRGRENWCSTVLQVVAAVVISLAIIVATAYVATLLLGVGAVAFIGLIVDLTVAAIVAHPIVFALLVFGWYTMASSVFSGLQGVRDGWNNWWQYRGEWHIPDWPPVDPAWKYGFKIGQWSGEAWQAIITTDWSMVFAGASGGVPPSFSDRWFSSKWLYNVPCFSADTRIVTPKGLVSICDVVIGDWVACRCLSDGGTSWTRVTQKDTHEGSFALYSVESADGLLFSATGNHHVATVDRGWVPVESLRVNDILLTSTGSVIVTSVDVEKIERTCVFNLGVSDVANYYVGHALVLASDGSMIGNGGSPERVCANSTVTPDLRWSR